LYAGNDPINVVDPSGRNWFWCTISIVGFGIGFAAVVAGIFAITAAAPIAGLVLFFAYAGIAGGVFDMLVNAYGYATQC
jgi:hypothetical protein